MSKQTKLVERLYDISRGSKIYADLSDGSKYLYFLRPDGMYSYCETEKGGVIHLSLTTPLVQYRSGYKIYDESNSTSTTKSPIKKEGQKRKA